MSDIDSFPFTPKEQIPILLAEYNTLRAEVLQRNTVLNQFLTVSAAALIGIATLALTKSLCAALMLLILLFVLDFLVLRIVEFDTYQAAERLRELEATINALANARLLSWETDHGLYVVGFRARLEYVLEPIVRFLNQFFRK